MMISIAMANLMTTNDHRKARFSEAKESTCGELGAKDPSDENISEWIKQFERHFEQPRTWTLRHHW